MPSDIVKRLQEQRLKVWKQAKELAERATEENRAFDQAEEDQWTTMNAEIDALDRRMKSIAEAEKRAKDTEEKFAELEGRPSDPEKRGPDTEAEAEELRAFLRGDGGRSFHVPSQPVDMRDLTVGTAAAGGDTVPTGFRTRLWEVMIETAGVLSAGVDLLETESGETITLPSADTHSAAAAQAEATTITEDDPTFGAVSSTVTKEGYLVQLSRELVDDSGVDLEGYLARAAGRALGNAVGAAAVTAALAAASAGVTGPTGASGGFGDQSVAGAGFDTLIDLFHSVIAPYRNSRSCAWLMADLTAAEVRKIKTTDGVYAWQPSTTVGEPDMILGKPVFIDPNVPDVAVTAESVLFGDWLSLVVRIAGGFRFERSDDFAFGEDLVSYRALVRHGSVSVDSSALKSFTGAAT